LGSRFYYCCGIEPAVRVWPNRPALPVADAAGWLVVQRSKKSRKCVSPKIFSGTANWTAAPKSQPIRAGFFHIISKIILG